MRRTCLILLLTGAAVLMAIPAFAMSLNFDFRAGGVYDDVYDTSWELDPPPPGGSTATVRVWLDGWNPPDPTDLLIGFAFFIYYDPATIRINSVIVNDSTQGGPFDPLYNYIENQGGGVYLINGAKFSCITVTNRVLLATIEIECIAAGDSTISVQTNAAGELAMLMSDALCIDAFYNDADTATALIKQSECTVDADCWNGSWCDGLETCVGGLCAAGTPPCADDGEDCTKTCTEANPPADTNPGTCNVCNATGVSDPCCQEAYCAAEPVCTIAINNYYVDAAGGSNANDGLTPATAWKTITYALSQVTGTANNQAIINVASGTYNTTMGGGDAETFPLQMESYVSLKGAGCKTTIIDAGQTAGVIRCFIVNDVSIEGFTLRNGWAVRGGAIFMYYSSAIAVTGCRMTDNTAFGTDGGAIFAHGTSPAITNCVIANNSAVEYGGGIACYEQSDAIITNCTIVNNEALAAPAITGLPRWS